MKKYISKIHNKGKQRVNKIKRYLKQLVKIETSPHLIALGFAIGTFIAIIPSFGIDIPLAIFISLIFPKINKVTLFASFMVWNPLIVIPLYGLGYKIGYLVFGDVTPIKFNIIIIESIYEHSIRFITGISIISAVLAVISYFVVKKTAKIYQSKPVKVK